MPLERWIARLKFQTAYESAIRGRLDGLSPEANSILTAAAAIGNEFEFNLCQSVAEVSVEEATSPFG